MRRWLTLLSLVALGLTASSLSQAQVLNGDFESGGADWYAGVPGNWEVTFPTTGGNPDGAAQISMFGDLEGRGCINQGFKCGEAGGRTYCEISVQYRLILTDGDNPNSGRIVIRIDGEDVYGSPLTAPDGWQTVTVTVPCGFHTLGLCLEADAGKNAWTALFDNVTSNCMSPVPVAPKTWSTIKAIYR